MTSATKFGTCPLEALERQRCLEVGMNDVLTKPVTLEGLKASLERWAR